MNIHSLLKKYWEYDSFRPLQEDIINSVLDGNDTLGLLPTGGGKSITFQVPALAFDGLTIVVTPLISLMKDQVDNLRANGIKATHLHSGLTRSEHKLGLDRCRLGKVKLLYISPEKLQSPNFIAELRTFHVSMIVVDEAHCISQWGYDFRPSYLKIGELRDLFPEAPVLALTASATPDVVEDIMVKLRFKKRQVFARSFSRDNLSYIVRNDYDKERQLLKILANTSGSAIVYVRSRRKTREIAQFLCENGISADYYHAGLDIEDKNQKQGMWKNDETRVMVATNAFGMGIDKPDVRVVVHVDIPTSLEEYYQEAGRAGRDGKPAFAVLIVAPYDKGKLTRYISDSFPDKDFIKRVYELAGNFVNLPVGEGYNRLFEFNFALFTKTYSIPVLPARSAMKLLTQAGYFEFMEEVTMQSRVMVVARKDELYDLRIEPVQEEIFNMLLRSYTGLFADFVYVNEPLVARRCSVSEQKVYETLLMLSRMHVIQYIPRKSTPYILYTTSRELPKYIDMPKAVYEDQKERLKMRIEAVKRFAFNDEECRVNSMLRYFGEKPVKPCGKCDVCRSRQSSASSVERRSIEDAVMYLVSQQDRSVQYLVDELSFPQSDVIECVRRLMDKRRIVMTPQQKLTLK